MVWVPVSGWVGVSLSLCWFIGGDASEGGDCPPPQKKNTCLECAYASIHPYTHNTTTHALQSPLEGRRVARGGRGQLGQEGAAGQFGEELWVVVVMVVVVVLVWVVVVVVGGRGWVGGWVLSQACR